MQGWVDLSRPTVRVLSAVINLLAEIAFAASKRHRNNVNASKSANHGLTGAGGPMPEILSSINLYQQTPGPL